MTLELLIPLGLLGLLGIVALIIIYIIKPNYQTKHVTTTYIWKLSLRYKKKRPPTSNIRNILIFICQVLILTAMAGLLAWPALVDKAESDSADVIYILDSSASMYTTGGPKDVRRFDCALEEIRTRANAVVDSGGKVSVIVATDEPYFLATRMDSMRKMQLNSEFDKLAAEGCSYVVSDIEGALALSREVLTENPSAELYVFTDTKYVTVPERVNVEVVRDGVVRDLHEMGDAEGEEWNAAILNATAVREDGYYTITVQVVCYGASQELPIVINVEGANSTVTSDGKEQADAKGKPIEFPAKYVTCDDGSVKTVIFRVGGGKESDSFFYYDIGDMQRFFSYKSINISIDSIDDSYEVDNNFSLYGGQKERIRVQYYSTDPNPFVNGALGIAHNALADRYELELTEVKKGGVPQLHDFDFYIFEHKMPESLPTDGVVLLLDPDLGYGQVPAQAGFQVSGLDRPNKGQLLGLAEGEDYEGHPVARNLLTGEPEEGGIAVSVYDVITYYDPAYDVLLTCDGNPVLMVQNDKEVKIAVMAFSVHYSNLAKLPENFLFMYNLFDYFFPPIVQKNAFEVNEKFTLNTWGEELKLVGSDTVFKAEEMPAEFSIDTPGSYSFVQTTYYGKEITVEVFVRPPTGESNIRKTEDSLSDPYENTEIETIYRDLLIIVASVLVALLFVEWWLQSRENK